MICQNSSGNNYHNNNISSNKSSNCGNSNNQKTESIIEKQGEKLRKAKKTASVKSCGRKIKISCHSKTGFDDFFVSGAVDRGFKLFEFFLNGA